MDAVGMGRDRKKHDKLYPDTQKMPLCRIHHTELHTTGTNKFIQKYLLQDYKPFFERD